MTTPAPRITPAPTCPPDQVGLCAKCHKPTHRYGFGGNPLCPVCREAVLAPQKPKKTMAA
ncbi:hypothetical protein [Streptomyces sp. NPDC057426]|uniref:hypothetical protein n=1 Tax=Streptomyces sp. NPDC057426 TaxID=3346128 RepID=UPI0036A7B568